MHAQIDLLRQTILDLRKDATNRSTRDQEEIQNVKSKLGELEKIPRLPSASPQGTVDVRLHKVETRVQALEQGPLSVRFSLFCSEGFQKGGEVQCQGHVAIRGDTCGTGAVLPLVDHCGELQWRRNMGGLSLPALGWLNFDNDRTKTLSHAV